MSVKHAEIIINGLENIAKELAERGRHGSKAVVLNAIKLIDELLLKYDPTIDACIVEELRSVADWLNNYTYLSRSSDVVKQAADLLESMSTVPRLDALQQSLIREAQAVAIDDDANRRRLVKALAALREE